jgi:Xaa-Pro dipeptidase
MPQYEVFPRAELDFRLANVRAGMADRGADCLLIASPESIYYLTGLDHWGFFAAHILVVPRKGEMALIARAMEGITVANQVHNAYSTAIPIAKNRRSMF